MDCLGMNIMHETDGSTGVKTTLKILNSHANCLVIMSVVKCVNICAIRNVRVSSNDLRPKSYKLSILT